VRFCWTPASCPGRTSSPPLRSARGRRLVGRAFLHGLMASGEGRRACHRNFVVAGQPHDSAPRGDEPGRVEPPTRDAAAAARAPRFVTPAETQKSFHSHWSHLEPQDPEPIRSLRRVTIVSQPRHPTPALTAEANHIRVIH
jgi:hypothetical protein